MESCSNTDTNVFQSLCSVCWQLPVSALNSAHSLVISMKQERWLHDPRSVTSGNSQLHEHTSIRGLTCSEIMRFPGCFPEGMFVVKSVDVHDEHTPATTPALNLKKQ